MKKTREHKDLEYYMALRYPVTVHEEPDGGFVAEIEELPGCMTQADTLAELLPMIEDARRGWTEAALADGRDVPLPRDSAEFSGRFVVRMPRRLHRELAEAAAREGVSLNQHIIYLLSEQRVARQVLIRLDKLEPTLDVLNLFKSSTGKAAAPYLVIPDDLFGDAMRKLLSKKAVP